MIRKHAIALILLAVTLAGSFGLIWLVFIDGQLVNPVLTTDGVLQTSQDVYHPGDSVFAYYSYCKRRPLEATIQWNLADTYIKSYLPSQSDFPIGCREKVLVDVQTIPKDTYPGEYYFIGSVSYELNAWNKVIYPLRTNTFQVVRP